MGWSGESVLTFPFHIYTFLWTINGRLMMLLIKVSLGKKNIVFRSSCDFDQKDRIVDRVKNMLGIYFVILNKTDEKSNG